MIGVVAADQGSRHGQVGPAVGGQQQVEAAQVQFIDAQRAGELRRDQLAVGREVQLRDLPAQAVVDEALGRVQEVIASQGGPGAFDIEGTFQAAVEDGVSHQAVVLRLGRDVEGPGAEELAAGAGGPVLGVVDVQVGDLATGQGADTKVEGAFAAAGEAAVGARTAEGAQRTARTCGTSMACVPRANGAKAPFPRIQGLTSILPSAYVTAGQLHGGDENGVSKISGS
jgi:hypothetical protein